MSADAEQSSGNRSPRGGRERRWLPRLLWGLYYLKRLTHDAIQLDTLSDLKSTNRNISLLRAPGGALTEGESLSQNQLTV